MLTMQLVLLAVFLFCALKFLLKIVFLRLKATPETDLLNALSALLALLLFPFSTSLL